MKVKLVTEEELKLHQEGIGYQSLRQSVGESYKIGGTTEAQTGAMLMYRIIGLERLLLDLPIAGFVNGEALVLKSDCYTAQTEATDDQC